MNAHKNSKQGFTIIEVVLVLAIAALIFLMVFIALPALQRNQRDTARRNDASAVSAALNSYRTNNRGSYQNITAARLQQYVDRLDQYAPTDINMASSNNVSVGLANVVFRTGVKCPDEMPAPRDANPQNLGLISGSSRSAAVAVLLENTGGEYQLFCQDA